MTAGKIKAKAEIVPCTLGHTIVTLSVVYFFTSTMMHYVFFQFDIP